MQQITKSKPDLRVYCSGQIDFFTSAAIKLKLTRQTEIGFFVDEESNLYVRKMEGGGLKPSSIHGARFTRYHSVSTAREILSLPDIPRGVAHAGFKIGESDDGINYPIITRRIL